MLPASHHSQRSMHTCLSTQEPRRVAHRRLLVGSLESMWRQCYTQVGKGSTWSMSDIRPTLHFTTEHFGGGVTLFSIFKNLWPPETCLTCRASSTARCDNNCTHNWGSIWSMSAIRPTLHFTTESWVLYSGGGGVTFVFYVQKPMTAWNMLDT